MTPMRLRKGGLYFRSLRPFARLDRRSHAGAARRRPRDMGSPFDFFSPKSWPSDTSVSDQAQQNRALLAAVMIAAAFGPTTGSGGTSRSTMSRSRIRISIFRSGELLGVLPAEGVAATAPIARIESPKSRWVWEGFAYFGH